MNRTAGLIALGAVAVRAAAAMMAKVIDTDSARNLRMAELITQGRFADALSVQTPTPPLHPFLTSLLGTPLDNLLVAGVAVSAVLGGLAALPLYAMARRAWDDRVATTAALLYALLPAAVDVQSEAMTEGTLSFFFLGSLWMGWQALEERSWEKTVVAAGAAALAWLSRPEGIYLLPLFLVAALFRFSRFSLPALALFGAVWLVLAFPYLCFIHAQTGHWSPSLSSIPELIRSALQGNKSEALAAQDYSEYRAVARYGLLLGGGGHLVANLFGKVLFYVTGPFLLIGLFRPRTAPGGRPILVYQWIAAATYLIPLLLSFYASTPFSHRFLLIPAALLLGTIAAGFARVAEWTRQPRAVTAIVGAICLAMLVRDLRPRRSDKVAFKEAGLAILHTLGPGRRLVTTNRQIEFYARSAYLPLPPMPTFDSFERLNPEVLALSPPDLRRWEPDLRQRVEERYDLMAEFPATPDPALLPVRVYRARRR
jgi:4-amino-4-deoxy-L-arabinose transferase-like glycosyltransferase